MNSITKEVSKEVTDFVLGMDKQELLDYLVKWHNMQNNPNWSDMQKWSKTELANCLLTDIALDNKIRQEHIRHELGDKDAWVCICGNMPSENGFYPCDRNGNEVEPVVGGKWDSVSYVCNQCGRIINQDTLEVIGQKA